MIERPEISKWAFVRMSDGAPYTKRRIVKSILGEVQKNGIFNAESFELGITGYEGVGEYDKTNIVLRNRILRLKKASDGRIIVVTENLNEYFITEEEMESWFEILKKARDKAKIAAAEAELAKTIAEERETAAKQKVPEEETGKFTLDNDYTVPDQFQQIIWAAQ